MAKYIVTYSLASKQIALAYLWIIEKQEKIITTLEELKNSTPELANLEQAKVILPKDFTLI